MDMVNFSKYNDGYSYVLVVIDVFSKYVWLRKFAQFFSGVQQSVNTFISDRIHKGNSDFDLAQWCSHRNVNDVRTVHNNASASASYSSSETDIFTNPTASPFANQASTDTQNLSKGVRSDSFTNVGIFSPNI
jgi:hypothetical protein